MEQVRITPAQLAAMERALRQGDRVELIPVKDGVKILVVRRRELKTD